MRFCAIIILLNFTYIQEAQAFWIGAAIRGVKTVKNKLTESKAVESSSIKSKNIESKSK